MVDDRFHNVLPTEAASKAGLRFGDQGTHTSRTMMLSELRELLDVVPPTACREEYATAIIEENVLGKQTASTCRLTNQRLGELYGLDPGLAIFRVLRRLWDLDEAGRPLLGLLCALGRDPLLRTSAPTVLGLPPGGELVRASFVGVLRQAVGNRLNDSILDKVARNAGSSWTQSGHLVGRVRKVRHLVRPTPTVAAYAAWLGALNGDSGEPLLRSPWAEVLDVAPATLLDLLLRARQMRLLHARSGGGVVEIDPTALDPAAAKGAQP